MQLKVLILILALYSFDLYSQVEHITISNPVYSFLQKLENQNLLGRYNLNDLPLSKGRIIEMLKLAENNPSISIDDKETISLFLREFDNEKVYAAVLIGSNTDSLNILSSEFYGDNEKYLYLYKDSSYFTSVRPLGSIDIITQSTDNSSKYSLIGNLGLRFSGSIDNSFGYSLQATNGILLGGDREVAFYDNRYNKNIKFVFYKDDIDFTESHINYQNNWFRASLGREYRQIGAGFFNHFIVSDNSPSFDAISLGAEFSNFKYKYMHSSLLGFANQVGGWETGFNITIPSKYLAMHRFSVFGDWGEVSFFEHVVYSDRQIDLAYLNPISFFKSLEHSLRDRDNAGIGLDFTIKTDIAQIKGTYFMDDVRFEKIGTGYWGNKAAWNLGIGTNIFNSIDMKIEYARVEPYTFSHFNRQNSMLNDGYLINSYLNPNSDRISLGLNFWYGARYPISVEYSYTKHGKNIIDDEGNIIRNVGGDALWTKKETDSDVVEFLDGNREFISNIKVTYIYEFIRGFNLNLVYNLISINDSINHYTRLILRFDNF